MARDPASSVRSRASGRSFAGAPGASRRLDIGTNSIHLVVARPVNGDGFETLTREREVVRLGTGGGDMKMLTPDAIDRGVACLQRMRGIAEGFDAVVRAVATSATREAINSREFIRARRGAKPACTST